MDHVRRSDLYRWCRVQARDLETHPEKKIPLRIVRDSTVMGELMAEELATLIEDHNANKLPTRAIVPCGPKSWYGPFRAKVVQRSISLRNLFVFHMDECLTWQGRLLPRHHPYNFRTFMEEHFYGDIEEELAVPQEQRFWLTPNTLDAVETEISREQIDLTLGGWGQDGHLAYNQARRHPFSAISIDDLADSGIRIQENNYDTVIALAQRTFGGAYQFVPPMSITLGIKQCLSATRVRVFSDTGAWKQTALRVALFSKPTPEYPMTLLQRHPDALIVATEETAAHPIADSPEWELLEGFAE